MARARRKRICGVEVFFAVPALTAAAFIALFAPLAFVVDLPSAARMVEPTSAALAAALFLRLLVSRDFHYAINRANEEHFGDMDFLPWARRTIADGDSRVSVQRVPRDPLSILMNVLFVEFGALLFFGGADRQWLMVTVFAGTFMTVLLMQARLMSSYPRQDGRSA